MIRPEELLAYRIFEQAIEDYKMLKTKNVEKDRDSGSDYSIKDIEKFFGGKWCTQLLELIGCQLTGKDILSKVQSQCA